VTAVRRALLLASLFVLAGAGSAGAETTCRFELAGTTMRLLDDCITDTSIEVPSGMTLDGANHWIVGVDPATGRFHGGVVVAAGRSANVVNTLISTMLLADGCETGARRLRGIYFDGAAGLIRNNVVSGIRLRSACEEGYGIEVRNADGNDRIDVEIDHNTVDLYQKTGVVVTGAANAWIHHNLVGASAAQTILPANSIQLGPGAGGVIELNTIRGNTSGGETAGTAVLLARSAPGTVVRANTIIGNADVGIYIFADYATVEENELTDTGLDGVHDVGIGNYGSGNRIRGNMVRGYATRYQGVADDAPAGQTAALE
jgi:hypothetical protein